MLEAFGTLPVALLGVLCALVCASAVELRVLPITPAPEAAQWGYPNEQGDDHLLDQPRNTCGDSRGRSSRRNFYRAGALARRRRQCLQGPRVESPPGHAIGVR